MKLSLYFFKNPQLVPSDKKTDSFDLRGNLGGGFDSGDKVSQLHGQLKEARSAARDGLLRVTSAANLERSKEIENLGAYRDVPLWLMTAIGKRDPEENNHYFYQLTALYFMKALIAQAQSPTLFTDDFELAEAAKLNFGVNLVEYIPAERVSKSLIQGFSTLLILIFVQTFTFVRSLKISPNSVFFLSYFPISWININGQMLDRHYSTSILEDEKFDKEAIFLVFPWAAKRDLFNPAGFATRTRNFAQNISRQFQFLTDYSSWSVVKWYLRLVAKSLQIPSEIHELSIDGLKLSPILVPLIRESFINGHTLRIIIQNEALLNAWKKYPEVPLVTIGQLFPESRVLSATRTSPLQTHVTVQHAMESRNKFSNIFTPNEFEGHRAKYLPDKYLVQGLGYEKILSEFVPKPVIETIGSLKYDDYYRKTHGPDNLNRLSKKQVLLVTPSLQDVELIMSFIENLNLGPNWEIWLKLHPATSSEIYKKAEDLAKKNAVVLKKEIVQDLLPQSDLVLFNYSTVGLEASFFERPAVRVSSAKVHELFDQDPNVPTFYDANELNAFISSGQAKSLKPADIGYYFYKFDGRTAERFWSIIKNLNKKH